MRHLSSSSRLPLALGLVLLSGAVVTAALMRRGPLAHRDEDAPRRALRESGDGSQRVVGRSVTIAKPRHEVYAAWRDFSRFPDFMENVIAIDQLDERKSKWEVEGPGEATISFTSTITEDQPDETIAWAADDDATVPNSGRITFRDAPGHRGTEVSLDIWYEPPGGVIGAMVAKMFQREPNIQARRDLKRFKQLLETGEIATSQRRPDGKAPQA